ncbi:MAG: hypothetical protein ABL963_11080 [Longimicrobiales bacterium]
MSSIRSLAFVSVALASLVLAACGGGDDGAGPSVDLDIRDFIAALATDGGVDAVFHAGAPPAAGAGPVVALSGSSAMITGGSAIRSLTSTTSFTTVILVITGIDGYWEITLPVAVTTQNIFVTLAQNLPAGTLQLEIATGDAGGLGAYDVEFVPVLAVGTGNLQVSVSWDVNSDVDLYVVEPGTTGEEIFYGNSTSASGGALDLDSNPDCFIDNVRNENVSWSGTPPSGTYTVRVNLYDACSTTGTNYVVTIRRQGQSPVTYQGALTGVGNGGASGAGDTVAAFVY